MPYFNATSAVGVTWTAVSSTISNGNSFTVEGQSTTNILLARNIWIPTAGSTADASTDIIITASTQTVTIASGAVDPGFNSFFIPVVSSTQTIKLTNNSGTTIIWIIDGVVVRT